MCVLFESSRAVVGDQVSLYKCSAHRAQKGDELREGLSGRHRRKHTALRQVQEAEQFVMYEPVARQHLNVLRDSISTCCATENGASTSSAGFFGTLIAGLLSSGAMGLTKARLARVRCRKSPQESSTTPGCDP